MINIKDVAKKAGVSPATVSLAMNGNELVNEETRKKVMKIASEMGYVSNPYARKLVLKKSGMIGVIIPDIENNFYASFVRYLNDYIKNTSYTLSILISGNLPELEKKSLREMIQNRMEGIIYIPINNANQNKEKIDELLKSDIPIICATTKYGSLPYVMSDLYGGMCEMTKHVIEKGYEKLIYMSGPKNIYTLDIRKNGFDDTIKKFKFDQKNVKYIFTDEVNYDHACGATENLIIDNILGSAIVCVNDIMALGVINTLKRHNINVPENVAVTGFDDGIFAIASPVPITTVHQNIKSIAKKSIQILISVINKDTDISSLQDHIIPISFITRGSI
jgi:LacI family transcriptional regulator